MALAGISIEKAVVGLGSCQPFLFGFFSQIDAGQMLHSEIENNNRWRKEQVYAKSKHI